VGFQCANHKKKVRRILPKAFLSSSKILFPFRTVSRNWPAIPQICVTLIRQFQIPYRQFPQFLKNWPPMHPKQWMQRP